MGRFEVLTGRERRRRWSREEKLSILKEAATSGLRVSEVARRHDVVPQQIYLWRRQLIAAVQGRSASVPDAGPAFLPVAVVSAGSDDGDSAMASPPVRSVRRSRIEVRCKGGRSLVVDTTVTAEDLGALIRAVERA